MLKLIFLILLPKLPIFVPFAFHDFLSPEFQEFLSAFFFLALNSSHFFLLHLEIDGVIFENYSFILRTLRTD